MKQLLLILQREYTTRFRRPSFWVLTLLIPVVLAAMYALPVTAAHHASRPTKVYVVDQTGLFVGGLVGTDRIQFAFATDLDEAERLCSNDHDNAILFIPLRQTTIPRDAFLYYQNNIPPIAIQNTVAQQLQTLLHHAILEDVYHLDPSIYRPIEASSIALHTQDIASGRESYAHVKTVLAWVLSVLMTVVIVLFGIQTFRAIQEECANRTAEVLATTVPASRLLLGKLIAIMALAVTQLVLWMLLTGMLVKGIQVSQPELFAEARAQQQMRAVANKGTEATATYSNPVQLVDETVRGLTAIRTNTVVALFAIYYILGLLLYGSLLSIVASLLDNDSDALQWTLLMASPMIVTNLFTGIISSSPTSSLGVWLTLLPPTSPTATMARLPFGVPSWQVGLSIGLMLLATVATLLPAARIYRRHIVK